MKELHKNICDLTKIIGEDVKIKSKTYYIAPIDMNFHEIEQTNSTINFIGCGQENIIIIFKRWRKLEFDFYDKKRNIFNISKIPDINDSIKYDTLHNTDYFNSPALGKISEKIFYISGLLASFVVPYEYGATPEKKTQIGMRIISPLFKKIKSDLLWWNSNINEKNNLSKSYQEESSYYLVKNHNDRERVNRASIITNTPQTKDWMHIRTRLYFTSASHLYSLFNVLYYTAEAIICKKNKKIMDNIKTLHYLSHIVFKLYENLNSENNEAKKFRLEVSMSPGCQMDKYQNYPDHLTPIVKPIILNDDMSLDDLENLFNSLKPFESDENKIDLCPRESEKYDELAKSNN